MKKSIGNLKLMASWVVALPVFVGAGAHSVSVLAPIFLRHNSQLTPYSPFMATLVLFPLHSIKDNYRFFDITRMGIASVSMLALVMLFSRREITGGVTPMRSATCAFVRLSCLRHSASNALSFSLRSSSCHAARYSSSFIHSLCSSLWLTSFIKYLR